MWGNTPLTLKNSYASGSTIILLPSAE